MEKKLIFYSLLIIFIFTPLIFYNNIVIDLISNFGSIAKFIKVEELKETGVLLNPRVKIWIHGYEFLLKNPLFLFTGVGYGENITQYITNVSFYESFFYQTLIELGIFGVFLLSLHFIYLILFLKKQYKISV